MKVYRGFRGLAPSILNHENWKEVRGPLHAPTFYLQARRLISTEYGTGPGSKLV
jgi:hypothetical protein